MEIRFAQDGRFFTYGAKAIIIEDSCLLMATSTAVDFYYPVGGGANHFETAEETVRREVFEETGAEYEIDRLLFVYENLFCGDEDTPSLATGTQCHEIAFYFLMKPRGSKDVNCISRGYDGAPESLHWLPIKNLKDYKMYPKFFYEKIENLPQTLTFVSDDRRWRE